MYASDISDLHKEFLRTALYNKMFVQIQVTKSCRSYEISDKKNSQAGSCMARQLICTHRLMFTEKNANVGPPFSASIILFKTTSAEKLNFSFDTYEMCRCD